MSMYDEILPGISKIKNGNGYWESECCRSGFMNFEKFCSHGKLFSFVGPEQGAVYGVENVIKK